MTQKGFMLALHRRLNLTRPRFEKLQDFFAGDWQQAYQAKLADWQAAGIETRALEKFFASPAPYQPAQEAAFLGATGAEIVTLLDEDYPRAWQAVPQAPAIFFVRGNKDLLNTKALSVVGSRRMTDYGHRVLGSALKPVFEKRVTVVSGLAYGVDAAAHELALKVGAPTVAVLGNGIDAIYPKNHQTLGDKIIAHNGLIISEYLPRTEARPEYFPQRNRLVAGLGRATVVVEAAAKSGSLITARLANECGREVWAVPGGIFQASSAGCNQLIAQGEASALLGPDRLLESLRLTGPSKTKMPLLSPAEDELYKLLQSQGEWEVDLFLAQYPHLSASLNATMTLLELKGLAQNKGGRLQVL